MSLHPSLKIGIAGSSQKTVLTRIERIKDLMRKGLWKEEQSVTGLPKVKIIRVKAAKAKKKEEDKVEAGKPAAATKEAGPAAKPVSQAKPAQAQAKAAKAK